MTDTISHLDLAISTLWGVRCIKDEHKTKNHCDDRCWFKLLGRVASEPKVQSNWCKHIAVSAEKSLMRTRIGFHSEFWCMWLLRSHLAQQLHRWWNSQKVQLDARFRTPWRKKLNWSNKKGCCGHTLSFGWEQEESSIVAILPSCRRNDARTSHAFIWQI